MSAPTSRRSAGPLVPATFVVAAAGEALWRDWGRPAWLVVGLAGSVVMLLLALRRSRPLLAMSAFVGAGIGGTLVQVHLPDPTARTTSAFVPIIALLVLSYSLAAYGSRRAIVLGAAQPALLVAVVDVLQPEAGTTTSGALFAAVILTGAPLVAGWLVRSRAQLLDDLRRAERRLAEEHQDRLRAARASEALQIWERLTLQLADGLGRIADLPEDLGPADLTEVETTARGLLAQTRTTVVGLSAPDPAPPTPLTPPAPVGAPDTVAEDSGLAWAVLVASGAGLATALPTHEHWSAPLPAVLLCAALVAGLALSWRHPLAGTTVAWGAAIGFDRGVDDLSSGSALTVPLLVIATPFLLGWLERRGRAVVGLLLCLTGGLLCAAEGDRIGAVVLGLLAWFAGRVLRSRTLLLLQVRHAHDRMGRERDQELRRIVLEERAALARDVHDAVGHDLTVLALQAGAARRLAQRDPAACRAALATVSEVARDALARLDGTDRPTDLDALVTGARRAGVRVNVTGADALLGLADPVRAATHRLLQESLTNAMRHSPGAEVAIGMSTADGVLDVQVSNGPAQHESRLGGTGTGLRGLAERVTALGGELTAGPTPDGGFAVTGRLPTATCSTRREDVLP
jgi:signal transduction histidine kinase